jgi:hypothetical protein
MHVCCGIGVVGEAEARLSCTRQQGTLQKARSTRGWSRIVHYGGVDSAIRASIVPRATPSLLLVRGFAGRLARAAEA